MLTLTENKLIVSLSWWSSVFKYTDMLVTLSKHVNKFCKYQGSRLTFQVASPVASDRFDSLAKTNFSLARHLNIHYRIKSSKC